MSIALPILSELPLFPLHTVLFPEALLPLRVFEARYLDMVRACLRENRPFGICLIKRGEEIAVDESVTVPENIGCLAYILDCDVEQVGVLSLTVRGACRFRLERWEVQSDGLLIAGAHTLEADAPLEDPTQLPKLAACSEVLERILAALSERQAGRLPFVGEARLDDAGWVSNRLAELLPFSLKTRQKLMALEKADARLNIVHQFMQQHHLL